MIFQKKRFNSNDVRESNCASIGTDGLPSTASATGRVVVSMVFPGFAVDHASFPPCRAPRPGPAGRPEVQAPTRLARQLSVGEEGEEQEGT